MVYIEKEEKKFFVNIMNQKGFINIIVIIGVVTLVAVAGYFLVIQQASSPNSQPSPDQQVSGIKGRVLRGPISPGPQIGTGPDEAPFSALFHVRDMEGNDIGQFESNDKGEFQIQLSPGEYLISPDKTSGLMAPTNQVQKVEVPEGSFIEVTLHFDTGIR